MGRSVVLWLFGHKDRRVGGERGGFRNVLLGAIAQGPQQRERGEWTGGFRNVLRHSSGAQQGERGGDVVTDKGYSEMC